MIEGSALEGHYAHPRRRRPIVIERPEGQIPGLWACNEELLKNFGVRVYVTLDYGEGDVKNSSDPAIPVKLVRFGLLYDKPEAP